MSGKRTYLVKMVISLSLVLLALIASLRVGAGPYARLVFFAMLFSFIGDYVLASPALRRNWGNPLPLGMLAFGIGHIFYIIGFFRQAGASVFNWGMVLMLVLMALWMAAYALRRLNALDGALKVGAWVYGGIIVITALVSAGAAVRLGGGYWLAPLGAILFVISDSLIVDGQVSGHSNTNDHGGLIWATYVPAQILLIVTAFF